MPTEKRDEEKFKTLSGIVGGYLPSYGKIVNEVECRRKFIDRGFEKRHFKGFYSSLKKFLPGEGYTEKQLEEVFKLYEKAGWKASARQEVGAEFIDPFWGSLYFLFIILVVVVMGFLGVPMGVCGATAVGMAALPFIVGAINAWYWEAKCTEKFQQSLDLASEGLRQDPEKLAQGLLEERQIASRMAEAKQTGVVSSLLEGGVVKVDAQASDLEEQKGELSRRFDVEMVEVGERGSDLPPAGSLSSFSGTMFASSSPLSRLGMPLLPQGSFSSSSGYEASADSGKAPVPE